MKTQILAISAFTLLLAGQSAIAGSGESNDEFLNWLDAGNSTVETTQFNKVSFKIESNSDYNVEADAFSLDYSSDK